MNRSKFALFLLPAFMAMLPAIAQDKLTGNWREVKRQGPAGAVISFSDTVFYNFKIGNEYTRQKKDALLYRGTYKLKDDKIDMGGMTFGFAMKDSRLMLHDERGTYTYEPYTVVDDESNSAEGSSGRANEKLAATTVSSLSQLAGKWEIFKRTSSAVQQEIDYTTLIKNITFYDAQKDGHLGHINTTHDAEDAPSWYIYEYSDNTIKAEGPRGRKLQLISYKNGELVLQEAPYTYFLKRFKE